MVLVDFPANDGFGGGGFAAAIGEIGSSDLLEVIDVVDEASFNFVHARVDVAGDGNVDEEHGTVAAGVKEVLTVRAAEDLLRSAGAGDDDVGARGVFVEGVERDGFGLNRGASEVGGQFFGAGLGSVDDENGCGALLDEVTRGQLGHFSSTDKEDGLALQRAEDFAREVYCYGSNGDAARANLGFSPNLLRDGEGSLEKRFELSGDGADLAGDSVGLFDLAEDLGFADDHAVERAGDAEEMADGFALLEFVDVRLDVVRGDGKVLMEEAKEIGFGLGLGGFVVVLQGEEFDAVTGGEDKPFADSGLMEEGAGGVGETGGGDGEALADLDGRGDVVNAE